MIEEFRASKTVADALVAALKLSIQNKNKLEAIEQLLIDYPEIKQAYRTAVDKIERRSNNLQPLSELRIKLLRKKLKEKLD
jgi:hypothetical protein